MNQVIFRPSIRRMRDIASKQKDLYRSFSSTTGTHGDNNNPKRGGGSSSSVNANTNVKEGTRTNPVASASLAGNSSSFSGDSGAGISIGSSTTISKHTSDNSSKSITSSFVDSSRSSNKADRRDDNGSSGPEFRSVYVHPLSQIVLEYLQDTHHEWVVAKGLDQSLTLQRDGSFELKHVSQSNSSMSTAASTPHLSSSPLKKEQPKANFEPLISASTSAVATMKDERTKEKSSDSEITARSTPASQQKHTSATSTIDNNCNTRIWTSYDEQEKKHWLTVRRGLFRQRFLLQDNLLTAWQGNRGTSLPERLQVAVDEMIRAVDRLDQQQQQPQTIAQQQWQQKGQRRFRKR